MKRFIKICSLMVAVGLALSAVGAACGGELYDGFGGSYAENVSNWQDVQEVDSEDWVGEMDTDGEPASYPMTEDQKSAIHSLDFSLDDRAELVIKTGPSLTLTTTNSQIWMEDETLNLVSSNGAKVTLTIPTDFYGDDVDISMNEGKLVLNTLQCEDFSLQASDADITISSLTASEVSMDVGSSRLTVGRLDAWDSEFSNDEGGNLDLTLVGKAADYTIDVNNEGGQLLSGSGDVMMDGGGNASMGNGSKTCELSMYGGVVKLRYRL